MGALIRWLRPWSPVLGAALANIVIFVAVLSVPLAASRTLDLTPSQLTAWIMTVYGGAALVCLALVWRYKQPLMVTGNIFVLLFVVSLGDRLSWAELVGASIVAGILTLALGILGWLGKLASWLPAPIVFGVLAGAVLPFFLHMFDALGSDFAVAGSIVIAYVLTRNRLGPLALFPALVVGLAVAWTTGRMDDTAAQWTLIAPTMTRPEFSLNALVTAVPVMIVLIILQANVPSIVFLRSQGYDPPEKVINISSGLGTATASILGPVGMSLSLPATAISAAPDAGPRDYRYRAAYLAAFGSLAIAMFSGYAATLARVLPAELLNALVGLAVLNVLLRALQQVTQGPLVIGPLFAFGVALSDLEVFNLGPFFLALVAGVAVSLLLEREHWSS
jgi:benzoate membrane transport protein